MMEKEKLKEIIRNFSNSKILLIGDLMLDKYMWTDVKRISPEAPVQIAEYKKETVVPGGVSNTANNIVALGAKSCLVGVVGNDIEKNKLLEELSLRKIDTFGVYESNRPTTTKTRILSGNTQLLRIDNELKNPIEQEVQNKIINFIENNIINYDLVIVSDYAKGVLSYELMQNIIKICNDNKKKIIADPKPKNKDFFKGSYLITPNHHEAALMARIEENCEEDLDIIGSNLIKDLDSNIIITRGSKGMALYEKDGSITKIPTKAKEVYDVSGAGDTFTALIGLALANGATLKQAANIANHAASIVVGKLGTATCSIDELNLSIENE